MVEPAKEFNGTERFVLRRRLGVGGMGVVYEALDREMDKIVALKTLTRAEAAHIYRFKREFRTLADVSHPNLVALYELMSEGDHWFFTMELVKGVTFIQYVRPETAEPDAATNNTLLGPRVRQASHTDSEADTEVFDSSPLSLDSGEMVPLDEAQSLSATNLFKLDESRLRSGLRQLAEGVNCLHELGKLHRDIKPSNVLVTEEGRVVLLDFGLVEDIEPKMHETLLAGTPDYMSPEQGAQMSISKASDWYSVGVILYQALTARLPFRGRLFEVMMRKQTRDPIQPSEINREVPRDLNDLCIELLRRDAEARPTGREVLRALGARETGPVPASFARTAAESVFIGRERLLAELHDAFSATREGESVSVYVHGNSGMGKSTLVRTFLDQIKEQKRRPIVLQGRCYERESVPYKALDGVVDDLSKQLASMRHGRAEALMPRNSVALARVFPVMLQVDAIFNARSARPETVDLFTLRRQAFGALRELLGRIADRKPLVIYIDDLQWADADSTFLLEDLLRPPGAPRLLLVGSFRTEDIEAKPFLKQLLQGTGSDTCRELYVGPLPAGEAREITRSLFASVGISTEPFMDSIVQEAGGSPFLLEQLTHYGMMNERAATAGITLSTMLNERIEQLPSGSRQFLDTLAVARRPVNQDVAVRAAGLNDDALKILSALRSAQFVRSGGTSYGVEIYHDRIGETLASLLGDEERRQIHRRLAQALEARGLDDPEALYEDYLGAGEEDRAAVHAEAAARKAASALAFDRAALYYRRAIELRQNDVNIVDLKISLGDALANAGRPAEAAREFLDAAKASGSHQALALQQRAGAQLLTGGHIEEGLEVFRVVLETAGFKLANGPRRALLSLILRRLWIRMRGLEFTERKASDIPEAELARIDICWTVAAGLGAVDFIRSADFQSRHLLLALRTGEPYRVSRAISFEAAQAASNRGGSRARGVKVLRLAKDLAKKVDHPHAIGMALWADGLSAYLTGHWKRAAESCDRAVEVFRDRCTGARWEIGMAQRFMLSALLYLGELADVSRRVPILLGAALEQGDVLAATDLRTRLNLVWLAADDPDRARMEVIEALKIWPREGFHLQHYSSMLAMAQIELYTDDAEVALKHVKGQYKALKESLLLRTQVLRVDSLYLQARTALAAGIQANRSSDRERLLKAAERLASSIAKEGMPWSDPLVPLIRAPIASYHGDTSREVALLSEAVRGFDQTDMRLRAMAARRRLGQSLGGDRGRELMAESEEWMHSQEIKNPALLTRMLAPGWSE
ncbi:MAG: eukaryotic-like serine/threonine-protein kinase [Blastocatellia bacterium]|jgi:serine/threonine protein kinase/tetratricopeptide (TPR) repeat protein|nr:eukaryotic-like serine/threonine-protein kinase [Blastocatellia bacterium]